MAPSDRTSGSCAPRQESHRAASSLSIAPTQSLGNPRDPEISLQGIEQAAPPDQRRAPAPS
jgi:hypothetical protein